MKNTFKWMFAAILICGLIVSSCKKDPQPTPTPDPEPTTQTMLTSMVATGVPFYDSVTYTYEYDAEYRLVRCESHVTDANFVIHDLYFTYSDGRISVTGVEDGTPVTIECTLDNEGRITHYERTKVFNDTLTGITYVDYTYDAEGRLISDYTITNEANAQGTTNIHVWEGDDIMEVNMEDGSISTVFTPSDAPAQALFNNLDYDFELKELCTQGCFGKLPAHMPAQRTLTTSFPIPGIPPIVVTNNYTYTVNAEGRLATCLETKEETGVSISYSFIWEEL